MNTKVVSTLVRKRTQKDGTTRIMRLAGHKSSPMMAFFYVLDGKVHACDEPQQKCHDLDNKPTHPQQLDKFKNYMHCSLRKENRSYADAVKKTLQTSNTTTTNDSTLEVFLTEVSIMRPHGTKPWDAEEVTSPTCRSTKVQTEISIGPATYPGLPVRFDRTVNICRPELVLGHGSFGTIVRKGSFDKRDVAVKQMLPENSSSAERELESLRQADGHPNVIRYYYCEKNDQMINIALELCEGTLQDYHSIKKLKPIELVHQIMTGLAHIHSLDIVHGNIRPDNILVSRPSAQGEVRVVISGFGRSRKLPSGEISISSTSDVYGTEGWAAPEMSKTGHKITPAVDIFPAGCLMYYVLTGGKHPFGNHPAQIQHQIHKGKFKLNQLPTTSDGYIAEDIIKDMLSSVPEARPTAKAVLQHLLFQNKHNQLELLVTTSDRIQRKMVHNLEKDQNRIFKHDWTKPLSQELKDAAKFYNTSSVRGLLRFIRNKRHHYYEESAGVQKLLGTVPDEFLEFFTSRYPLLLIQIYQVMKCCSKEDAFKAFYKHT